MLCTQAIFLSNIGYSVWYIVNFVHASSISSKPSPCFAPVLRLFASTSVANLHHFFISALSFSVQCPLIDLFAFIQVFVSCGNIIFLFTPTFWGKQPGRKTRAGCALKWVATAYHFTVHNHAVVYHLPYITFAVGTNFMEQFIFKMQRPFRPLIFYEPAGITLFTRACHRSIRQPHKCSLHIHTLFFLDPFIIIIGSTALDGPRPS